MSKKREIIVLEKGGARWGATQERDITEALNNKDAQLLGVTTSCYLADNGYSETIHYYHFSVPASEVVGVQPW